MYKIKNHRETHITTIVNGKAFTISTNNISKELEGEPSIETKQFIAKGDFSLIDVPKPKAVIKTEIINSGDKKGKKK